MYSEARLMRGDLPPRTSELIFEMLKMLTLQRSELVEQRADAAVRSCRR